MDWRDCFKMGDEQVKKHLSAGKIGLRALLLVLETLALLLLGALGAIYIFVKGPSDTAARLFVHSTKETSAIGFLPDIFCSEEEIEAMLAVEQQTEAVTTDLSLISISAPTDAGVDEYGLCDDDGDGIILEQVSGEGYTGYMMIVLDPSRVILGTDPSNYGTKGYTVEEFAKKYDAVAAINGGAFEDTNGRGNGSLPEGLVVNNGEQYGWGVKQGFAGIDNEHILHVGCRNGRDAKEANIMYGASYGPVLVQNGEMMAEATLESGVNPRTAIGQRADGAFLLLVIDGRQVISLGATYLDEAEIMLDYGAVNAVNMDGGSSSMMWYNDGYVNNCASVIGIRAIPTAFVVLKQAEG